MSYIWSRAHLEDEGERNENVVEQHILMFRRKTQFREWKNRSLGSEATESESGPYAMRSIQCLALPVCNDNLI